jgi:hypothetical protein
MLDSGWAEVRVREVFPDSQGQREHHDAAWQAYIRFNRPYDSVFDIMPSVYKNAVERLGDSSFAPGMPVGPDDRLGEHLVTLYWRGKLTLAQDSLLAKFFGRASEAARAHAIAFVGSRLGAMEGGLPSEVVRRLSDLWEWRLSEAQASADRTCRAKELAEFGWWLLSGKFEFGWSITQVVRVLQTAQTVEPWHMVFERLAQIANEDERHAPLALECIHVALSVMDERWRIFVIQREARDILKVALNSCVAQVRTTAEQLTHRFVAMGHFEFRELLPSA